MRKLPKARENSNGQVQIGLSFESGLVARMALVSWTNHGHLSYWSNRSQ